MVKAIQMMTVLSVCSMGWMSFAAEKVVLGGNEEKEAVVNRCWASVDAAVKAKDPQEKIDQLKQRCQNQEDALIPVCKDESKEAATAFKEFATACSDAGFSDLKKCVQEARAQDSACALASAEKLVSQDSKTTPTRILSYFETDKTTKADPKKCVKMGLTDFIKNKSEYEKTLYSIESDITKASATLAERKKTLNDQISRLTKDQAQAETNFAKVNDEAVQKQQEAAIRLSQDLTKLEQQKAETAVRMYEPMMKESQNYAEEKVALRQVSDIRGICVRELKEKLYADAGLYKNSGDQFTQSTISRKQREDMYWECVDRVKTQIKEIKDTHAQFRAAQRTSAQNMRDQITSIDAQKRELQNSQAAMLKQIQSTNQKLASVMQTQMAQFKTDADGVRAAITKTDEDFKKQTDDLEKRRKNLYEEIAQLGEAPQGTKPVRDANAKFEALLAARENLASEKSSCEKSLVSLDKTIANQIKMEFDSKGVAKFIEASPARRADKAPDASGGLDQE